MYAIYGNIYHQYTPNVSIYTIHGSYGIYIYNCMLAFFSQNQIDRSTYTCTNFLDIFSYT